MVNKQTFWGAHNHPVHRNFLVAIASKGVEGISIAPTVPLVVSQPGIVVSVNDGKFALG